ncbi:MAG: phenylalanine--tRNA ligase subunit beta [Candidatus Nanosyncoccus sp.]
MLISLNALKHYVKIPDSLSTADLMKLIGSRLVEVEGTESLAGKYQNIYVAKVVKCTDIPDTHLHLCEVDAGSLNQEFGKLENGLIQVVCGAPNIRAGLYVVWLAPGAIVPSTFGTENFQLSVRKLRGFLSYGMIAGADELGFGTDHKYIAELAPDLAKPGTPVTRALDLDDLIIDIENKSLTHRPDTFGLIGFAREVAGILNQSFENPEIFQGDFDFQSQVLAIDNSTRVAQTPIIEIQDSVLCPRYSCVVLDENNFKQNIVDNDSLLTREGVFLYKSGMRPISQIVDATNLTMLETGQPLHAFDYDKFIALGGTDTPKIIIRAAKPGEKITLIDDTEVELNSNDIVITSNNVPVALAGSMGGKNTEIDANTKRILIESATFSLYNLRKTQMAHGIFSEAITRFTKGQPVFGTIPALRLCLSKLGVKDPSKLIFADCLAVVPKQESISITLQDLNQTLGAVFNLEQISKTLKNVGFLVELSSDNQTINITAPLWRTDIHIKEDIYEEVGRLTGFDNIPKSLPLRPFKGSPKNQLFALKREIRNILSDQLGANELLTYSFVSKALQEKVGENITDSYEIINSISPELQCFRQSLVPSLLEKVYENQKAGYKDFILYEMNQVAKHSFGLLDDQTPKLESHLAITLEGDFYKIKNLCLALGASLGFDFIFTKYEEQEYSYFEPLHSANISLGQNIIGALGEIKYSVQKSMKLKGLAALELNLGALLGAPRVLHVAQKISRFPSVSRDLTIKTPDTISFENLEQAIKCVLTQDSLIYTLEPVSIYRQSEKNTSRNCSFHLCFASTVKTMSADEISAIMKQIEQNVTALGAEII